MFHNSGDPSKYNKTDSLLVHTHTQEATKDKLTSSPPPATGNCAYIVNIADILIG